MGFQTWVFLIFFIYGGNFMITRNCTIKDVDRIRKFVNECKPLNCILHLLIGHCLITFQIYVFDRRIEKTIGFISGIKSSIDKDVVYLWQIGVSEHHRGKTMPHF